MRRRWNQFEGIVLSENNELAHTDVYSDAIPKAAPSPSDSKKERVKESAGADSKKYCGAGFATLMTQPGAEVIKADVFEAATTATPTAPSVASPVSALPEPEPPDPRRTPLQCQPRP